MVSVEVVSCEGCGAQLNPEPGVARVTCEYCGATSLVNHPGEPRSPTPSRSRHRAGRVLLGLFLLVGVVTIGWQWLAFWKRPTVALVPAPSATAAPTPAAPTLDAAVATARPAAPTDVSVRPDLAPLVFELDSTHRQGFVVPIFVQAQPSNVECFATYNADGVEQARSPEITLNEVKLHAIGANQLITASSTGQLTAYALPSATQQWTTALGDRVFAICPVKSPEQLLLMLEDDRRLTVDMTTGRQNPTREQCKFAVALNEYQLDARNRHDYAAPAGIDSYHCGGVRVMGGENFTISDPCLYQAHVDPDRLQGIEADRIWKINNDWLVFGVRKPGLRLPMVGLVRHGKVVWSSPVPAETPLEADEGPPYRMALFGDAVAVAHRNRGAKQTRHFVTVFDIASGSRRWTARVSDDPKNLTAVTTPARLLVQTDSGIEILDGTDGHHVGSVGRVE